jgi:hypothetical protein
VNAFCEEWVQIGFWGFSPSEEGENGSYREFVSAGLYRPGFQSGSGTSCIRFS